MKKAKTTIPINRGIKRYPSPAMVVAVVALFVGLAGSSYAVTGVITQTEPNSVGSKAIKNNSITGKDIKKNAIKSSDIKNGQVKGKDIAKGAVTTNKIKDGAVTADKLASGVAIAGPAGPPGATGAQGATNVVRRETFVQNILPTQLGVAISNCNPGEVATGGGGSSTDATRFLRVSSPRVVAGAVVGWTVIFSAAIILPQLPPPEPVAEVSAFVVCASP